ncbi:aspartyl protease family protein [Streptomyces sp. R33]|uniref:Aspartyl protease family protein n=1 Tax=Streptomyces sp. R33 TaxID=3238629 RepID=A0AB39Y6K1_9ACTN
MVRITGPSHKTVEVLALIDTGATASSMDTALAKDLGFDLAATPQLSTQPNRTHTVAPDTAIRVRSAMTRYERPRTEVSCRCGSSPSRSSPDRCRPP